MMPVAPTSIKPTLWVFDGGIKNRSDEGTSHKTFISFYHVSYETFILVYHITSVGEKLQKIEINMIENNGKINKIRWKGGEILSDIDINELPKTIQTCISLAKEQEPLFLDGKNPVTFLDDEYLEKFLDPDERSERQQAIIKVLANERDWLSKKQLAERVGKIIGETLTPHNLAGPLSGFTKRLRKEGKEELIETRRISEGEKRKYKCYRIKPQYKEKTRKTIERLRE